MDEIIFTPHLPFTVPDYLEGLLFEIGYRLYQFLFIVTGGRNILFSNELILLILVAIVWMCVQFFQITKK
jgi:hypothetical protein